MKENQYLSNTTNQNPLYHILDIIGIYEDTSGLKNIVYKRKDSKSETINKLPLTALTHGKESYLCELMIKHGIIEAIEHPPKVIKSFFIENIDLLIDKKVHIISKEGFHEIETKNGTQAIFVKNGKVFPTSPLADEQKIYLVDKAKFFPTPKGNCKEFNKEFNFILQKSPRMLCTLFFSKSAFFYKSFDIPPLSLFLVGPTSIGKTVIQRFCNQVVKGESNIQTAHGTSVGIFDFCNSFGTEPIYFEDAHGKKIAEPILSIIMNTGNHASRLRSTYSLGEQSSKNKLAGCLILSGEKDLKETAIEAGEIYNDGVDSRYFPIHQGKYGMFDDTCGFSSIPELIQFIENRGSKYLGVLGEQTISYVASNFKKLKKDYQRVKPIIMKKIIANTNYTLEELSNQSSRLLNGLVFNAYIARQAIKSGALAINKNDIDKALGSLFNEHLTNKSKELFSQEYNTSIIKNIQNFIKIHDANILPFKKYLELNKDKVVGLKFKNNDETIYLIKPSLFKNSSNKKILNNETSKKLIAKGLMKASKGRGHQYLKRLPNKKPESFIAISSAIMSLNTYS